MGTLHTGIEAVSWLVKRSHDQPAHSLDHAARPNLNSSSRDDSIKALTSLADLGFIEHVTFEHRFEDVGSFYMFSDTLYGWHTSQAGWLTAKDQSSAMPSWYVLRSREDPDTSSREFRLLKYTTKGVHLPIAAPCCCFCASVRHTQHSTPVRGRLRA